MTLTLDGLMVAQVTPFTPGGQDVDLDWLPGHLDWLRGFGVSSVLTLGTNGEGPSLSLEERRRVVETVAQHAAGLGVVAGAGCAALPDTIRAANDALDAGADAVALLPPYFFPNVDAQGLVDYFGAVIEALPAEGRALLYNIPSHVGLDLPDEVVLALVELHGDRLLGIKDSSGDPDRTRRYVELAPEGFSVLAGADHAHADLYDAGCVGGVTGMGNAVPALVKAIQHAHRTGGRPERAQRELNALGDTLAPFPRMGALKQLIAFTSGLPRPAARPPHRDLTKGEVEALEVAVAQYLMATSEPGRASPSR